MNFPLEKYRFIHGKTRNGADKVVALTTYAGKAVRGVAICSPDDTFSLDKGKELAAARCALKVAQKRLKRAGKCLDYALGTMEAAQDYYDKMVDYYDDATGELYDAEDELNGLLESFR